MTDTDALEPLSSPCWIILVNWNKPELTAACIRSLQNTSQMESVKLLIVDNGSSDGSVTTLEQQFPHILVLETGRNLGFAGGANLGFKFAMANGAEYVGLVNNDVEFEDGTVAALMDSLQSHPSIGVVCPLVSDYDGDLVWALGLSIDNQTGAVERVEAGRPISAVHSRRPFEVEAATGTMMLMRRQVLEDVGLLDESFYLYYEEVDWSIRVSRAGYRIAAVPRAKIRHHVSASLQPTSPLIDYYMVRNQLLLLRKHWPFPRRLFLLAGATVRALLSVAAFTLKSRNGQRTLNRNARLYALRDAFNGRWGRISLDAERACTRS